ncbi:hypothetical protein KR093_004390 [Drosophila rubida]|uniref:RecA family profile 1 domain-containing protein n=1 Tax=Drosophila rubida TaxID=30044 RepID=A0AAD4PK32_9MUSC|nr:hypothetical protein KR093_004390 [Drosophila rubida]
METKEELESLLTQTKTGNQLSDYNLKLLKKQKIKTPHEFLDAQNLHKLLALSIDQVEQIKRELMLLLVRSVKFKSIYQNQPLNYSTGIAELDKLLDAIGQPWRQGRIWELYGEISVGKTELLHTLAVNFVCQYRDGHQVLFVDTKRDFNARRVHEMLKHRQLDDDTIKCHMQAINVIACASAQSLIKTLEAMIADDTCAIKLVLIDSLAASFMLFRSSHERNAGRSLLTHLAMLMRTLATQHGIAFVLLNWSPSQREYVDDDDDNDDYLTQSSSETQEDASLLGDYWDSVCTLSLKYEFMDDSSNDNLRLMRILNNSFGVSEGSCVLHRTHAGIN